MPSGEITTVYQYFAANGALIYVGVTDRGTRRLHEHAESKPWWSLATGCTLEHYLSRAEALAREKELIARHRPPYNQQHNPERSVPLDVRTKSRLSGARLVVGEAARQPKPCSLCGVRPRVTRGQCLNCYQSKAQPRALEPCAACGESCLRNKHGLCRKCSGARRQKADVL